MLGSLFFEKREFKNNFSDLSNVALGSTEICDGIILGYINIFPESTSLFSNASMCFTSKLDAYLRIYI